MRNMVNDMCATKLLLPSLLLAGCGLESLIYSSVDNEHELPVSVLRGNLPPGVTDLQVIQPDGQAVTAVDLSLSANGFEVKLPSSDYQKLRVVGIAGEAHYSRFVPALAVDQVLDQVHLDVASTTSVLVLDSALSSKSRSLQSLDGKVLGAIQTRLASRYLQPGPEQTLLGMVERIFAKAEAGAPIFNAPTLDAVCLPTSPTLREGFLARGVDYDGDGANDSTSAAFDTVLASVACASDLSLDGCLDPERIRVVFEVDFNDGRKDGNCDNINRFKWVREEPGKQMFFVGGVHMESPVQNPELDGAMGNRGGWTPNQVPMFDDGTNGDAVAGDNIWTVYFDVPRGARLGYKYTWGKRGQLWTGTEEWPGNQHIIEAVDVNGDNIVYRQDNFGEEATNKDKSNLNRRGNGSITWDTDVNGDGIPDARERPLDLDHDCVLDEWVTPAGIGPLTVECE